MAEQKFKVGDRVRIKAGRHPDIEGECRRGIVTSITQNGEVTIIPNEGWTSVFLADCLELTPETRAILAAAMGEAEKGKSECRMT